jgi:centromere protein J
MKFPSHYHNQAPANQRVVEQIIGHDGKIQRVYENGKKEVIFNNGVKREVFPDGYTIVYFNNSDIKQTYTDQKVVYYFAEAKTTQTTFSDGLQVFKFANNQIEKHFPDGTKEIM